MGYINIQLTSLYPKICFKLEVYWKYGEKVCIHDTSDSHLEKKRSESTECSRKVVPGLHEDCDKTAKDSY